MPRNFLRDLGQGVDVGQNMTAPIVQGLYRGQDVDYRMQRFEEEKRQDAIRNALAEKLRQLQQNQFDNTVQNQQTRLLMTPGVSKGMPGPYPDIKTLPGGLNYSPTAANAQSIAEQKQLNEADLPEQNRIAGLALQDAPLNQIQQSAPNGLAPSALDVFNAEKMKQGLNTKLSAGGSLVGPQGNIVATAPAKPSAIGGPVDPAAIRGMIEEKRRTGKDPALGMGGANAKLAYYAVLGGSDGSDIISEGAANKAARAGLGKALGNQQTIYQATKTAIGTLDKQLDLADQYSRKVDRTGSPLINRYLLAAKNEVFGDPDTQALENIVTTAANEFAKILSGSAASIAGVTVSSADDAKKLLRASLADGTFQKITALMRQEGQFRLQSNKETIDGIMQDQKEIGGGSEPQGGKTKSGNIFQLAQ